MTCRYRNRSLRRLLHLLQAESQANLPPDPQDQGGGILSRKDIKNREEGFGMIGKSRVCVVRALVEILQL